MTNKVIAKIDRKKIVRLISPKSIGQREAFRIMDTGNLSQFPVGSEVEIKLESAPNSKDKVAIIVKLHKEIELEAKVIDFKKEKDKRKIILNSFKDGLHFYLVFNPLFNQDDGEIYEGQTQAHSFFNLLKNNHEEDENSFLYWGKIKSTENRDSLCLKKYQQVVLNNNENKKDTYLFISDFSFFWVAKVQEVRFDLGKEEIKKHSLKFYENNYNRVEAWFKVTDMTLLSNRSHDTLNLISNLVIRKNNDLNCRIDDKKDIEITPFLSGLRYPLIIEDEKIESYFGNELETLKDNPLLGDKTLTSQTKDHINGYVIPPEVFNCLSNAVQREIITAEMAYSNFDQATKNDIYAKDYDVARKYLIILEKIINETLIKIKIPINSRVVLGEKNNLSLNDISKLFFSGEFRFLEKENKRAYFAIKSLCKKNKVSIFSEVRNTAVHMNDMHIPHETLVNIRREVLGVGKLGYINTFTIAVNSKIKNTFYIKEAEKCAS